MVKNVTGNSAVDSLKTNQINPMESPDAVIVPRPHSRSSHPRQEGGFKNTPSSNGELRLRNIRISEVQNESSSQPSYQPKDPRASLLSLQKQNFKGNLAVTPA